MYNGIINVYKEKGYTSFDVVGTDAGHLWTKEDRTYRNIGPGCGRCFAGMFLEKPQKYVIC